MATYLRRIVSKKVLKALGIDPTREVQEKLSVLLKLPDVSKKLNVNDPQLTISSETVQALLKSTDPLLKSDTEDSLSNKLLSESEEVELIEDIRADKGLLHVRVRPNCLIKIILHSISNEGAEYGRSSNVHHCQRSGPHLSDRPQHQRVVIEYSSPNIAKPFHAGHLRSTILGNVLANLYQTMGHSVTRLNYLGDWGTQFGLLSVGYKKYGNEEMLANDPIRNLFEVYVKVNKDVSAEKTGDDQTSSHTYREGLQIFRQMEQGHIDSLKLWQQFRDLSMKEYQQIYERLGVKFDEYHGEAMYQNQAQSLVERWKQEGLLKTDQDTGVGYLEIEDELGQIATVLKSDGTSLYLTRDIAAILDRKAKYNFDKIHYVVDFAQENHFKQMRGILHSMTLPWLDSDISDRLHVPFGRVEGMSTRRGQVVFLSDILNEAKSRMLDVIMNKETSKPVEDVDRVADVLGVSAIIVQDLKQRRMKSYKFSWERTLNFKADSGVFLQYSHARLTSLRENCGVEMTSDFDPSCLLDPEAQRLVLHLASFDAALNEAFEDLEPCFLVHYLFKLVHLTNLALYSLPVKGQPTDIAQARLFLFMSARQTLANGLHILGIEPLDRM